MNYYLKYQIKYQTILDVLNKTNKKKINFFIDLQNIARGMYNKDVILMEINRYAMENKISNIFIDELKQFLNNLYTRFKNYDPFFIISFDDGQCQQNTSIQSTYKNGRSSNNIMVEDFDIEIFRNIKQYYFNEINNQFNKKNICKVYYLKEYESDFIPFYCITENIFDAKEDEILNVILSVDKDLLQCCKFLNTIQCATTFHGSQTGRKQIHFGIYDNVNAIQYIYNNFKRGILTAEYIPLILSLTGDKADGINGIKGIGPARAVKIIEDERLPSILNKQDLNSYPKIIQNNFEKIQMNYKLISFEEQIKRIPKNKIQ